MVRPLPARPLLLAAAIVLIALNMRPALTSVGPVLPEIMRDAGLSAGAASLLTTLPVVCLGLFGPLAPLVARRFGTERAILLLMPVLAAGVLLRWEGSAAALFASVVVIGAAIGIVNVLVPSLLKRDFPDRAVLMTGVYTMSLCAGAAVAAGATAPLALEAGAGWPLALAAWAVPAVLAALLWWPMIPRRSAGGPPVHMRVSGLWRDPLAWQVTLFMGLQSSLAYSVFGWLAPILRDRGLSAVDAGIVVSVSILIQVPAALLAPALAKRWRTQRPAVAIAIGSGLIGLLGCVFAPLWSVWGFAAFLGIGQGAAFSLALILIVLRAGDSHVAAHLSGMAQGVGYVLAAGGPLFVGLLHEWAGGWGEVGVLFTAIALGAFGFGMGAARPLHVGATSRPAQAAQGASAE
ncbi:CynX/NimT family MFS transporter [Caenispirillum bisanense]|uniref:MFS transporter, CP family, cyanate transporter n=1 Tax=Caenispirillum bisanense TaxID=414052 RepID=A0A286GN32_9PROT|nr:MFS transporter [Caenispirillum bisanense]SOD96920.1 MFS transporter, CP family, cyanate transporter [Caenispirillum bisanense]